jgi:hypothetical protein
MPTTATDTSRTDTSPTEASSTGIRHELLLGPVHFVTLAPQQRENQVIAVCYELNVIDGWVRKTEWTDNEGILWIGQDTTKARIGAVLDAAPTHASFAANAHVAWINALTQAGERRRARDQRRALDTALLRHGLALKKASADDAAGLSNERLDKDHRTALPDVAEQPTRQSWQATYEPWRHGGWYVTNVRYPSGAVGCVSRNYGDRKWRIACDPRDGSFPGGPNDHTYPSREAAARAERDIAAARCRFETTRASANIARGLSPDHPGLPAQIIAEATPEDLATLTTHELNVSILDYDLDLARREPPPQDNEGPILRTARRHALDELHARALGDHRR